MKKRTTLLLTMSLIMVCLILGGQASKAQNASTGTGQSELALSGSALKSEEVAMKADAIFTGQITSVGVSEGASSGTGTFGASVKVLQVLLGAVDPQIGVRINVAHRVDVHEEAPKVGITYIFFIKKVPGWNIVLKLLPATDDNIAKVKALIAATPASK